MLLTNYVETLEKLTQSMIDHTEDENFINLISTIHDIEAGQDIINLLKTSYDFFMEGGTFKQYWEISKTNAGFLVHKLYPHIPMEIVFIMQEDFNELEKAFDVQLFLEICPSKIVEILIPSIQVIEVFNGYLPNLSQFKPNRFTSLVRTEPYDLTELKALLNFLQK